MIAFSIRGSRSTAGYSIHGAVTTLVLTSAIACLAQDAPVAARALHTHRFSAPGVDREVSCTVQLPPSYANGITRYGAVYVLHGLFENDGFWERRGLADALARLWTAGEVPEFVLIAVDGGNSFFINGPAGRYQDLVTRHLVAEIESRYRVRNERQARGLLGISMGGYAALRIAFAQPESFGAVAAHSAMLLSQPPTREAGAGRWHMDAFHQVFGNPIDPGLWTANDPLELATKVDPRSLPALRFDCGAEDRYGLAEGNRELHRRLEARGVPHVFSLPPGDHGYEYVHSVIGESLRFLGQALR